MVFALTGHVAAQLRGRGLAAGQVLLLASLPPFVFGPVPDPVGSRGGKLRLLSFGRLLPYKGLDLLADALSLLQGRDDLEVRVVGSGPETGRAGAVARAAVRDGGEPLGAGGGAGRAAGVADALVLSHREASQSGVAAAAIAARRWVVATRVGGLVEQMDGQAMAVLCEPEAESLAAGIRSCSGVRCQRSWRMRDGAGWRRAWWRGCGKFRGGGRPSFREARAEGKRDGGPGTGWRRGVRGLRSRVGGPGAVEALGEEVGVSALAGEALAEAAVVEGAGTGFADEGEDPAGAVRDVLVEPGDEHVAQFERQAQQDVGGVAGAAAMGGLHDALELGVVEAGDHGGGEDAGGDAGFGQGGDGLKASGGRAGAGFHDAGQRRVQRGDGEPDANQVLLGQALEDVGVGQNAGGLGDDADRGG